MNVSGNVLKLKTAYLDENFPESMQTVQYFLSLGDTNVHLNALINKPLQLVFEGTINCVVCGKRTKTSFGQGSCYACFMNAPQNSPCIINPELCEAHLGKGRDIEWEQKNHNKEHIVYLAKSSAIKIGVTGDFPMTRWIDQGASEAIILAKTPYRQLAGEIEVMMKSYFTDKTNWQQMLKNQVSPIDLLAQKESCFDYLPSDYHEFIAEDDSIFKMNYPVSSFPNSIKSIGFDKTPIIESTLKGIKGQYLYFDNGQVLNIRKHAGYFLTLSV